MILVHIFVKFYPKKKIHGFLLIYKLNIYKTVYGKYIY